MSTVLFSRAGKSLTSLFSSKKYQRRPAEKKNGKMVNLKLCPIQQIAEIHAQLSN